MNTGRVARVDRGAADVLTDDGMVRATYPYDLLPAVGDVVQVADGAIAAIEPRRSQIVRGAPSGESVAQVLAANVDAVLVVAAITPEPKPGMLERVIALAWDSGATPVIVLTKADLHDDPDGAAVEVAETALGVDVLVVSVTDGRGLDELQRYDDGRTLCMIGRSGAGKSTLANALLGNEILAVGEVRRDGKGRHTTTHRELLDLPGGGWLIDTPGLRGVGMHLAADGLAATFPEIEELTELCRFSDCSHTSEPGCAVQDGLADGAVSERRYESWRKLQREAEWMASRTDHRLRVERRKAWQQEIAKAGKTRP